MQKAFALALALATLCTPLTALAKADLSALYPRFMSFGAEQDAPRGFTAMCAVDRTLCDKEDRAGGTLSDAPVLSEAAAVVPPAITIPVLDLKHLRAVNRRINTHVRQMSDERAFGQDEMWRASGDGPNAVGDCEDLALQKMVALRAAGYPASSLMLAVAYHRRIGLHTVLVVRTQSGDYVLDNMAWSVKPWAKVKYSWLRVQSPADPNRWYRLS